jgi:Domain of unknown function (DUF4278)
MVNLIDFPQIQSAVQPPTADKATHTLIYRGTTYEVPQHKLPSRTPEEIAQLIGKRLTYRGTTYEMVPAATPEPRTARQLCYRGVTFTSNTQPTQNGIDYIVV